MTFDFGGKAFQDGFAQKVANLICFLCGLCVSLRLSALKGPLTQRTQRYAEAAEERLASQLEFFVQPFFDSNQSITANKRSLVVFKGNTVWPRPVRCTTIS